MYFWTEEQDDFLHENYQTLTIELVICFETNYICLSQGV